MWCEINNPFAFFRTSVQAGHIGFCTCFINKYKAIEIKLTLPGLPFGSGFCHVFALLLAGVQRFF
jgi:hypothetical protein